MAASASDVRAGIGARLKAGRERAGMTLLIAAEKLHVDPKVLEVLEAERFEELGAPVYVRGHLRRYAELIGENATELLDQYAAQTSPALPDLTKLPKVAPSSDARKLVPSLLVLIVFALVGSVWWVLQNVRAPVAFGRPAGPQPVMEPPPGAQATLPAPGGASPASVVAGPASGNRTMVAVANSTASHVQDAKDGASLDAKSPPAPGESGAASASSAQPAEATANSTAASSRAGKVDLTLTFSADSWVEVYDANGARLFYDIGSADSSRTFSGAAPLRVVLGNAPGVTLGVNGKPAVVPAGAVRRNTAHFMITRSGQVVRVRPEAAATPASQPDGG